MGLMCQGSLVLYKNLPARVIQIGRRITIVLPDDRTLDVRPQDVSLLHPGPVDRLEALPSPPGEVETAWELVAGGATNLAELAELIYGVYTPATAWATWRLVDDGLYFHGAPQEITARSPQEVAQERAARQAQAAERQAWADLVARLRAGRLAAGDEYYLREVEELALGRSERSRLLRDLGRGESAENGHALLLELAHWDVTIDPYPHRLGVAVSAVDLEVPPLPAEARRDLTHLPALAIDDEGCQDPDDALSLDGDRLWVHVADVAALVPANSPIDLEARARGASLYLPEGAVPMLPPALVAALGLGLESVSPALSFGLDLTVDGEVANVEVTPSWVRVARLTYEEAEGRLGEEPLQSLLRLARRLEARRQSNGAVQLTFPEVRVRLCDGLVSIRPLPPLSSRDLVREAMLIAGEAVARFALERGIPFAFVVQDPSDAPIAPGGLAEMYALRRTLRPSQARSVPAPHASLGLPVYSQVTSPLRRYLDLVAHQQLRAYLRGEGGLSEQEILQRVGAAEAVSGSVRQAERLATRHWTLVYLLQHPDWQGQGVLLEKRGSRARLLLPDLDLETWLHLRQDVPLNSMVRLALRQVDLPTLEAHFALRAQ